MMPSTPTIRWSQSRKGAAIIDEPDSENSLFSEPMKMRTPSPRLGAVEQVDHVLLGLEIGEQQPDALEVLERREVLEQVGLAAHDQLALAALQARPAREPGVDQPLGEVVEFRLGGAALGLDLGPRLGQRAAADAGVEVVAGFDQRRGRQAPAGSAMTRFSTEPSSPPGSPARARARGARTRYA